MVRNAGKFGKPKRGGGKHFTSARVLKADAAGNEAEGMWGEAKASGEESSSEEEEEEEEESSSSEDGEQVDGREAASGRPSGMSSTTIKPDSNNKFAVQSRQVDKLGNEQGKTKREVKKAAKAKQANSQDEEDDEDDDLLQAGAGNKNLSKQMKLSSLNEQSKKPAASATQGMNRKERDEQNKKEARERYLVATRLGKTEEGASDLARLAVIRKKREEEAERKKAELASSESAKAQALAQSGRKR